MKREKKLLSARSSGWRASHTVVLGVHTRDLASAEEALSDALVKALITGPRDGVPQNPEAWLLTTGRHSIIDAVRHERVVSESEPTLQLLKENFMEITSSAQFPDERLKLLFVCAHPAIDPAMHTPLMLQTVLRCAHRCQLKALMNANTFSAGLRYFEHELNCGGSKSCNRRNGKNDNSYG